MENDRPLPDGFHLVAWGVVASTPKAQHRFAQLFSKAWGRIPSDAQEHIRKRCEGGCAPVDFCDHKNDLKRGPTGDAVAQCDDGHVYTFVAPAIAKLPDDDVITLIAHELAHGYLFELDPLHGRGCYEADEQGVADVLVSQWKFSAEAEEHMRVSLFLANKGVVL
jgi:hypothetical protein